MPLRSDGDYQMLTKYLNNQMMKDEIRKAIRLSEELEDQTFEMQGEAFELLEEGKKEAAVNRIKQAWDLLPEPKFNTSCSHTILSDLAEILTAAGKHEESKTMLESWIHDTETCGFKIYETTPYILLGNTFMHLNKIDNAKEQFYNAVKHGGTKRDFSEYPTFYFEVAKKKMTDNSEIEKLFDEEVHTNSHHQTKMQARSDGDSEQIDELSEKGSEYFEEENYTEAIKVWQRALSIIPDPQNAYAESLWLETSIGDAYFLLVDYKKALAHLQNAKSNIETNAYENPFIMLRLGQALFENNLNEDAKEYLLRAYMVEGEEIFQSEDDKYFDFLKRNVQLK